MEQAAVYRSGRSVGTLWWEEAGLYICFHAQAKSAEEEHPDLVPRLWLVGEDSEQCLGVPQPERGLWRLERRLARRSCQVRRPLWAEFRYKGPEEEAFCQADWQPWPEEPGLWYCREGEDLLLAAPWQGGHCALVPMFCLCSQGVVAGKQALILRADPALELLLEPEPVPAL